MTGGGGTGSGLRILLEIGWVSNGGVVDLA